MIGWMRLVLSTTTLLTVVIDPESIGGLAGFTLPVLCGYTLYSALLYLCSQMERPWIPLRNVHWLDVLWYGLIVFFTGYGNSPFFLFFFFAILTAAFRWGFDEGARITLSAAFLFLMTALVANTEAEISKLLLRTTFLLALGYMIAYWGGSEVAQKRRLALLRDVSQFSNPRFGVDQTVASLLDKICHFFGASRCVLIMREADGAAWILRTAVADQAGHALKLETIESPVAAALMGFTHPQTVWHARSASDTLGRGEGTLAYDADRLQWKAGDKEQATALAELLETSNFLSIALPLRRGEGRMHLVPGGTIFDKADGLFLADIAAQAFPVIENIALVDRMASDAAARERAKIARDLHDTTIQPYIGLKLALHAVRKKAADDNPLVADLDRLESMTAQVVHELRRTVHTVRDSTGDTAVPPDAGTAFIESLRQQVAQAKEYYGIDIAVRIDGECNVNDRLAAEIFQIVSEGLSNIRKHTGARRGMLRLCCANGMLHIEIENVTFVVPPTTFLPRSIAERASALGGSARVAVTPANTTVFVTIPV